MTCCELTSPGERATFSGVADALLGLYSLGGGGNMKTKETILSQLGLWRISLAGLCLLGTLVADSLSDWSAPVSLGATVNAASADL